MKRASYRHAVELIALNDSPGDDGARDPEQVAGLVSVGIVAELFGVEPERLAGDVVRYRERTDEPSEAVPPAVCTCDGTEHPRHYGLDKSRIY